MSKIAVVGTGYVGLVSGEVLSDFGHSVTCIDNDENTIVFYVSKKVEIISLILVDLFVIEN